MALVFIDSMAHYGTGSDIIRKWSNVNLVSLTTSGGRRNSAYLGFTSGLVLKTIPHGTRFIQGAAVQYGTGQSGQNLTLAVNTVAVAQLQLNNDRTISVLGGTKNLGTTSLAVSDAESWHYYEMDATIGTSGGTFTVLATVHIDGFNFGTFTGTSNVAATQDLTGQNSVNQCGIFTNGTLNAMDFYCLTTTGTDFLGNATTNTTFLGDVEIDALFPAADVTTNWGTVGGDGTHAYTVVNRVPAGDDSDYIYSTNTTTASEGFNYQPISGFTGTLLGAQYLVAARKDAEGTRILGMTVGTITETTLNFLGTKNYLSDYYIYYITPLDSDNGVAWTTSVFNAEVFGWKNLG